MLSRISRFKHNHLAVKKQKDQAIKQARHWKACYQKERSAHIKLQEKCEKLMQELGEIYEDEHRRNFPPGVPVPKWPVSEYQTRPVPKGDLPVPKPAGPAYLISTFKSQTLGLSKENPIGKKVVKKHAKLGNTIALAKGPRVLSDEELIQRFGIPFEEAERQLEEIQVRKMHLNDMDAA